MLEDYQSKFDGEFGLKNDLSVVRSRFSNVLYVER